MNSIKRQFLEFVSQMPRWIWYFLLDHLGRVTGHTLGLLTIIFLQLASVPTLLSVLLGQTDRLPPVDLMIFVWAGLTTLFFKALLERNFLYLSTICVGFIGQTLLMGLILFR
jgi:hypothetical protein